MAKDLMGLAVEHLGPLRVVVARLEGGHRLDRLDEFLAVCRALIACRLHPLLDDEERFPAAEHMGIGGDILGIADRGAVVIHPHGGAIEGFRIRGIGLFHAVVAFPEMRAFQEFEAGRGGIDGLQAVDEAKDLRPRARSVEIAQFLDEGQDGRADHDVIENLRLGRDLGQIAGEAGLGRRDGDLGDHLAPLGLDRFGKEIAVVIAEGVIGIDHRHFLAEVVHDPGRHGGDLRAHIGDAGLQRPAVQHARGHVIAFGTDEVGDLQFARPWGGADDDMGKKRAEDRVATGLRGQLFHHFGAALGIGGVVFEHDLDRAAIDAAAIVQHLESGLRGAFIPAPIGRADAGAVQLEAQLDRGRGLRPGIAGEGRGGDKASPHPLEDRATARRVSDQVFRHGRSLRCWPGASVARLGVVKGGVIGCGPWTEARGRGWYSPPSAPSSADATGRAWRGLPVSASGRRRGDGPAGWRRTGCRRWRA